jgi:quercetin dioxygenase-like cupin family protein
MATKKTLMVKSGETEGTEPLNILGETMLVKLSGADTEGSYAILENYTPPQAGPPLHRHSREDESFYILEGEFLFEVDGRQLRASAGDALFAPRGTAHTFQNAGKTMGHMLVVVQPAGLELFFEELSNATRGMQPPDMSVIVPIATKHGLELLGPPLSAR